MCDFREVYEPLLVDKGVVLYLSGHTHHYSRSKPVGVKGNSARGIVHVVVGTGGYELDTGTLLLEEAFPWVAFRAEAYGYGRLRAENSTHLSWEFVERDSGKVVDRVVIG